MSCSMLLVFIVICFKRRRYTSLAYPFVMMLIYILNGEHNTGKISTGKNGGE